MTLIRVPDNLIHYVRYRLGLEPAHSQTSQAELDLLARSVRGCKTVVEIGVFEGVATLAMRRALDIDACLIAIDPFPVDGFPRSLPFSIQRDICLREINKSQNAQVQLIRRYSYEVIDSWSKSIDLIYLDADQGFDGIRWDFFAWSTHVRPGGLILVHNGKRTPNRQIPNHCGPLRLITEVVSLDSRFNVCDSVDSIAIVEKY